MEKKHPTTNNCTRSHIFLFSLVAFTLLLTLTISSLSLVSAANLCSSLPTLSSVFTTPSVWGNISAPNNYLFNATTTASLIDTACWDVGMPWEAITVVYKPFPNQCSNTYHGICAEDTDNYSSSRTYFSAGITNSYCVNTDNSNWRWLYSSTGLAGIQSNYSQICAGGAASIDNGCNAKKYFATNRNGAVNYSKWNATGTTYVVNTDVAAFHPTCFGAINGTVQDSNGAPISGVNVTLLIIGPQGEKQYISTTTSGLGTFAFASIPATNYRVLFSKNNYNSEVVVAKVNYTTTTQINVILLSGSCNFDCTTQADPSRCSAACNGIGGCNFFNTTVANLLNGAIVNTQQLITIGATNYTIQTCEGTPTNFTQPSLSTASITCPAGATVIILERIVLKDGQPVKVVIPVCRTTS